jgi:hypothetical protein
VEVVNLITFVTGSPAVSVPPGNRITVGDDEGASLIARGHALPAPDIAPVPVVPEVSVAPAAPSEVPHTADVRPSRRRR